jgi:hypothetical protein
MIADEIGVYRYLAERPRVCVSDYHAFVFRKGQMHDLNQLIPGKFGMVSWLRERDQ